MANPTGPGQQQQMMFYYMPVVGHNQGQGQFVQGQEGMTQGQFDGSQQMPTFSVQTQGGYYPEASGNQMIMMQPNMMVGHQPPNTAMSADTSGDASQGNTGWGNTMPTQTMEPPPTPGSRSGGGSKAFKIVNPQTLQEVTGGKDGQGSSTTPTGSQQQPNPGQMGGCGGSQAPMQQQPWSSGGGNQLQVPQNQAQRPAGAQAASPQPPSTMPQSSGNSTAAPTPQGTPGPVLKKPGMKMLNKKLGVGAFSMSSESKSTSGGDAKPEEASSAVSGSAAPSPAPSPEATQRKPAGGSGGGDGDSAGASTTGTTTGGGGAGESGSGGGSGGGSTTVEKRGPLPRLPQPHAGASSQFQSTTSSIKALNLEPMRTAPVRQPRPLAPVSDEKKDAPAQQPSTQQQTTQQPSSAAPSPQIPQNEGPQSHSQQQPSQTQQSQPSPVQPQTQPTQAPAQNTQTNQMQPQQQMQQQPTMQMPMQTTMHMQQIPQMGHTGQPMMQAGQGMYMYNAGMHPMMMQAVQHQPHMDMSAQQQPQPAVSSKPKGIKVKNTSFKPGGKKDEDEKKDADGDAKDGGSPAVSSKAPIESRPSLKPADSKFSKLLMLRIWRMHKGQVHNAVQGLSTYTRPDGSKGPAIPEKTRRPPRGRDEPPAREAFPDPKKNNKKDQGLKPSEFGYKINKPTDRQDCLSREVRGLLNKICPENLNTIVDRLAGVHLQNATELEFVIKIIFEKALAEPHWCETYADMVFALRTKYPEFPAEHEGEKGQTFIRVLLNTCQNEFEQLPTTCEPTAEDKETMTLDEMNIEMKRRKDKMLANMKFIGNLFLRQLLAVKVIGSVVHELIGMRDKPPEEHMIECVCELLQATGHTLDSSDHGKKLMAQFTARLVDLQKTKDQKGRQMFSKRIQFQIQDLLDLRANDWKKKLFKDAPKKKEDFRQHALAQDKKMARGGNEAMFSVATVGQRPGYINELKPRVAPRPEAPSKPDMTEAYVKKIASYYLEDKKSSELEHNWYAPRPNDEQTKKGIEWLLNLGFEDKAKEEGIAEVLVALLHRGCFTASQLEEMLSPHIDGLEDLKVDVPNCDLFFHSLLARLIMDSDFNPSIVKKVGDIGQDFAWGLIVGGLKKVKAKSGADTVRKAIGNSTFSDLCCKVGKCSHSELENRLDQERCL